MRFKEALARFKIYCFGPSQADIVKRIVAGVAGLEILRSEYRELAPVSGVHGSFRVEGNSNPVFNYTVFDKSLMEFVEMEVRVSLPDRIEFSAQTVDLGGIHVKDAYARPFYELAQKLYEYFPFPMPKKPELSTSAG